MVATGFERHRGIFTAFGANHGMHLALALAISTIALATSCLTAGSASLRLVGETLLSVKRLLVCTESERLSTF